MLQHNRFKALLSFFLIAIFCGLTPSLARSNDDAVIGSVGLTVKNRDVQRMFIEAGRGNMEKVKYYIEDMGIDVNHQGEFRKTTLLHWAAGSNNISLVRYLVAKGADIGAKDYQLKTPLHYASQSGDLDTVIFLIRRGANPEYKDQDDKTALYYAHKRAHYDMLEYLEKKTGTKFKPPKDK